MLDSARGTARDTARGALAWTGHGPSRSESPRAGATPAEGWLLQSGWLCRRCLSPCGLNGSMEVLNALQCCRRDPGRPVRDNFRVEGVTK